MAGALSRRSLGFSEDMSEQAIKAAIDTAMG